MKEFYLKIKLNDEYSCEGCPKYEMGHVTGFMYGEWTCKAFEDPKGIPSENIRPSWCPLIEEGKVLIPISKWYE